MIKKAAHTAEHSTVEPHEIDALQVEFLTCFYDKKNRKKAEAIAARLSDALAASEELAESIRGEEIRSLIAELKGDVPEAIRCREAEIRKILELHTLTANTPSWEYVASQYDFTDVSDRLDLLAILYDRQGNRERAIATLYESRQFCRSHRIAFDGEDLLADLESARNEGRNNGVSRPAGAPTRKVSTKQ